MRRDFGPDHAACSGPVVHHDRLAQGLRELRSDQARNERRATAGRDVL
jgi:hypothetical protein